MSRPLGRRSRRASAAIRSNASNKEEVQTSSVEKIENENDVKTKSDETTATTSTNVRRSSRGTSASSSTTTKASNAKTTTTTKTKNAAKRRRSSSSSESAVSSASSSSSATVSYTSSKGGDDRGGSDQQEQQSDNENHNDTGIDTNSNAQTIAAESSSVALLPKTTGAATTGTTAPFCDNHNSTMIGTGGCLKCGEDDDHANLMLCEGCNDEYHIYCLDPPLRAVPQDDWFCDNCKPQFRTGEVDDGLDLLVTALPPNFTSRFGEIVWAAGGVGFGWWPACIYDPRLTVGSARQLARKNLGKKHLVYFFECHEAPFSVLTNTKLYKWEEGLVDDFHIGKAARSAGKSRTLQFEHALQAAMVEHGKPVEMRLEWNHQEHDATATLGTSTTTTAVPATVQANTASTGGPKRKPPLDNSSTQEQPLKKKSKKAAAGNASSSSKSAQVLLTPSPNRTNFISALMAMPGSQSSPSRHHDADQQQHSTTTPANEIESSELYCTILLKKSKLFQVPLSSPHNNTMVVDGSYNHGEGESSKNGNAKGEDNDDDENNNSVTQKVGFIKLQSRLSATFADARKAIESDIDHICLPPCHHSPYPSPVPPPLSNKGNSDEGTTATSGGNEMIIIQWRFYIPNMGPVSLQQETKLGPMYAFLKETTTDPRIGEGNLRNPLKVIIAQYATTSASTPTTTSRYQLQQS